MAAFLLQSAQLESKLIGKRWPLTYWIARCAQPPMVQPCSRPPAAIYMRPWDMIGEWNLGAGRSQDVETVRVIAVAQLNLRTVSPKSFQQEICLAHVWLAATTSNVIIFRLTDSNHVTRHGAPGDGSDRPAVEQQRADGAAEGPQAAARVVSAGRPHRCGYAARVCARCHWRARCNTRCTPSCGHQATFNTRSQASNGAEPLLSPDTSNTHK